MNIKYSFAFMDLEWHKERSHMYSYKIGNILVVHMNIKDKRMSCNIGNILSSDIFYIAVFEVIDRSMKTTQFIPYSFRSIYE